jgi:4-hydroxybenzoate polyprenyltransferase
MKRGSSVVSAWLRAIRPHHWAKNLLVLVPAAAAHALTEPGVLAQCAIAFAAFSLMASGTYVINDVLDAESDRSHPTKKQRPVASRELGVRSALAGALLLIGAALTISWLGLPPEFLLVLSGYLVLTLWYSLDLKQRAMVDILCLATLYTGRILGGSAATGIEPTFWLLAFSMLLFFSLAAAKRATELAGLAARSERQAPGRGYRVSDLPLLVVFGVVSAYASVLLLALYVNARGDEMYARPVLLWLLCPALLYWVSRIWLKTYRQELHEDPLVFALTDRPSLAVAFVCAALVWFAI